MSSKSRRCRVGSGASSKDWEKLMVGGIKAGSFIKAWHIAILRFDNTWTIFLLILWAFWSLILRYSKCCLEVFVCDLVLAWSSRCYIMLILSMASTRNLLLLSIASMTDIKVEDLFLLTCVLLGTLVAPTSWPRDTWVGVGASSVKWITWPLSTSIYAPRGFLTFESEKTESTSPWLSLRWEGVLMTRSPWNASIALK